MKQAIFLLLLCLPFQNGFAQEYEIELKVNQVIARSGLRLRAAPNLKAKKLLTIPFGETVKVLSKKSFGPVTKIEQNDTLILGYWVKASYNGVTGYVSNKYLYYRKESDSESSKFEKKLGINQEVVLLYPSINCITHIYDYQNRHWYGFSKGKNGQHYKIVPVVVEYYSEYMDGPGYTMLGISTKPEDVDFVIGTKKPLSIKETTNWLCQQNLGETTEDNRTDYLSKENIQKINELLPQRERFSLISKNEKSNYDTKAELWLIKNGQKQLLNPTHFEWSSPSSIKWSGDIDGDGKRDYIIKYGTDESSTVLYLSSKAEQGQFLKPVAIWYNGPCC